MSYKEINMFKKSVEQLHFNNNQVLNISAERKIFRAGEWKKAKCVLCYKRSYLYKGYDIHVAAECVYELKSNAVVVSFSLKCSGIVWATLAVVLCSLRSYYQLYI